MKLPKEYDLYHHNAYLERARSLIENLAWDWNQTWATNEICARNLEQLKDLSAIITHLELAIDEVLKVPGVSDE